MRNPWGQFEWNGKWSKNSDQWNDLSKDQQDDIGKELADEENGEFWIEFTDMK